VVEIGPDSEDPEPRPGGPLAFLFSSSLFILEDVAMTYRMQFLIDVVRESELDPVVATVEEAEDIEDHFRSLGWDARRVETIGEEVLV
jgi:hypothetical protein